MFRKFINLFKRRKTVKSVLNLTSNKEQMMLFSSLLGQAIENNPSVKNISSSIGGTGCSY